MTKRKYKNRVAEVNAELKRQGRDERLTAGRGYYYFRDIGSTGDAWRWSGVYVYRADELSLAEWLAEYNERKNFRR